MKIILSPAKKMHTDADTFQPKDLPVFLPETRQILSCLQSKSYSELKTLWGCNDAIAETNQKRLQEMDLTHRLTPAILSYEGIAYQYMAPSVFEDSHLLYVQEHLRILSGFYGVLRPMDGVQPYRLEMQAKLRIGTYRDLYEFWGDKLYRQVHDADGILINLASREYFKCIEKYLTPHDTCITCTFAEMTKGKMVQKGTWAKMARGEMVRFMAEHQIQNPQDLKAFNRLGYQYRDDLSSENDYVFERISACEYAMH